MPPTVAATKHSHFTKHNRNSSKLSAHSRSNSSTKLNQGHGHNLAFTALKADPGPPKRVDSSQTIRSDNAHSGFALGPAFNRPGLTTRQSSRAAPHAAKKPKFAMPPEAKGAGSVNDDEIGDEEDDDDEDQWVSSGVVTPDDREEQGDATPQVPPHPSLPELPHQGSSSQTVQQSDDHKAGPSSAPTYDTAAIEQHRDVVAEAGLQHPMSGFKTAPSSRPPSVRTRRPPSLIRTQSFTPTLNSTAPPLTTTSIASAQITSTNLPEGSDDGTELNSTHPTHTSPERLQDRESWKGVGPLRASPPGSPTSARFTQSRSAFLPAKISTTSSSGFRPGLARTATASSVSTLAANPSPTISPHTSVNSGVNPVESRASDSRNRKGSAFSVASGKLGAVTSGVAGIFGRSSIPSTHSPLNSQHPRSAAMSSLQAIPKRRDTPPPLTSHFPPESQLAHQNGSGGSGAGGMAFSLLPAPYMAAHMAVRAYEAPLQDAFTRVVLTRPRPAGGSR